MLDLTLHNFQLWTLTGKITYTLSISKDMLAMLATCFYISLSANLFTVLEIFLSEIHYPFPPFPQLEVYRSHLTRHTLLVQ